MKKLCLSWLVPLVLLSCSGLAVGQSKPASEFLTDFRNHNSGPYSFGGYSGMADHITAPYMAIDIADMYWDAFALINGYTYAFMAFGDFQDLDFVLDVVSRDITYAENLSTTIPAPQGFYQVWNFDGFPANVNHFGFNGTVNLATYINGVNGGSIDPLTTGYGRRTNANGTSTGTYITLDEGMYNRNIAQLARVMHNNIGEIGNLTSSNGQTYRQRLDFLVAHLRDHVWARNFENPNIDNNHYDREVYRVNTHMSSHLAMVALCLWVIEGDQKYRDFVEEFLWDFSGIRDANPSANNIARLPSGRGFLDKLEYRADFDRYWWVAPWDKDVGGHVLQDASHAVAELQLVLACYEEGIGLNPPAGEPPVDLTLMQRLANSIQHGYLKGYTCADGTNEPSMAYRLDGTGFAYGLMSTTAAYAQFNENIMCYLEQRTSGIDLQNVGTLGGAMYAARVLGVGGDEGPVFTPTGAGVTPSNFRPIVTVNDDATLNAEVGDVYNETGATWNDIEDGTGQIAAPTSGSVPLNGSNEFTTAGTFLLEYAYTDTGSLTGSATKTINVGNSAVERPSLTLSYSDTTITQFSTYTPPTYTWTDAVDGSGTTGAVISDGNINPDVVGVYTGTVAYTNSGGLTDTDPFTVRVEAFSSIPVQSIVLASSRPFYLAQNSLDFPAYTVFPLNATDQTLDVTVLDQSIVEVQETGDGLYQFLGLQPGITTFTITSRSNPTVSVSGTLIVQLPNSIITIIIQN